MEAVLGSSESGFEFEMDMIVVCVKRVVLEWVPIRTIYADEQHQAAAARRTFLPHGDAHAPSVAAISPRANTHRRDDDRHFPRSCSRQ